MSGRDLHRRQASTTSAVRPVRETAKRGTRMRRLSLRCVCHLYGHTPHHRPRLSAQELMCQNGSKTAKFGADRGLSAR
ncbi:hypothetical protein FKP32DRAFT_860469 [Trametes sanguinea]|nr:hypothetical protein FKP32DRAFT_860469 [Trametes sanguinea]